MSNKKAMENLTESLVNFNTENFDDQKGGYTLELLAFVKALLSQKGIDSKIYEYTCARNIDGEKTELKGRGFLVSECDKRKPVVLLQGHADTVPVYRKFEGKNCLVKNDTIYGRGAVDMKSSLAAFILTLIELKSGTELPYQPVLLITSDEEAGNFRGIKEFLRIYEKEKMDIAFAICGEATAFALKHNFLGAIYLRFIFEGESGHSANRQTGGSAIEKAVPFLNGLMQLQKRYEHENSALGSAVLNVGVIRGGNKVNELPTRCEIEVSLRTTRSNRYYEKEIAAMSKACGGKMEKVFSYDPVELSPDNVFLARLKQTLEKSGKCKPENIMKEFTEATLLNTSGISTVVFGPGNPLLNHSHDECIKTREVQLYAEILEDFLRELQAGEN